MANVAFKRGTQAGLDAIIANKSAADGTFYLTKDTHRLYVGIADGVVEPVNEGIKIVSAVSALPAVTLDNAASYRDNFYYAVAENILCVWNGEWVQINPDTDTNTVVSNFAQALTFADDTATITSTVTSSDSEAKSDSFSIKGAGGASVSVDGKVITITTESPKVSEVSVAPSDNGGFTIGVKDAESDNAKTTTFDPVIAVGETPTSTDNQVKFVNGQATLPVYSKDDIDKKLQGLDAMTFRGVVDSNSDERLSQVKNGDVFKVGTAFTIGQTAYSVGDLLIAQGTEDSSGFIPADGVTWERVSSGDGAVVTYGGENIEHGVQLKESGSTVKASLALATEDNSVISLTDSGENGNKIVTINHNKITATDTEDTAVIQTSGEDLTFTVVTGVTKDDFGHVSGVKTKQITVKDTTKDMTWSEF